MNRTIFSIIGTFLFIGLGLILIYKKNDITPVVANTNIKNISVKIGDEVFNLINGKAEKEIIPGSITKNILQMFGSPVTGDLDGDGDSDAAILLENNPGGSGTFYYAVLALNNNGVYKATNSMFLGDRIAPQTIEIRDGRAVYNYAIRKSGEAFSVPPSIGKSTWVYLDVKNNKIGEWVKDFEGESDPNIMTLGMKKWVWEKTQMNDGKVVIPKKPGVFTLTFENTGFRATTDCNSINGSYKKNGNNIEFTKMASTLMYCEGSQEQDFSKFLGEVGGFMFTNKGELILMLKVDSGTMMFR